MYACMMWHNENTIAQNDKWKMVGYDNEQMASEWSREYGGYKIRSVKAQINNRCKTKDGDKERDTLIVLVEIV